MVYACSAALSTPFFLLLHQRKCFFYFQTWALDSRPFPLIRPYPSMIPAFLRLQLLQLDRLFLTNTPMHSKDILISLKKYHSPSFHFLLFALLPVIVKLLKNLGSKPCIKILTCFLFSGYPNSIFTPGITLKLILPRRATTSMLQM